MGLRLQIRCIRKRPSSPDAHARIEGVGGMHGGRWFFDEDTAIRHAESGKYSFYVDVSGRPVDVVIAIHDGRKYLKSLADGDAPTNLLNLPECP